LNLVVSARRADRLESLATQLRESPGAADVLVHAADLRREEDIAGLFAALRERFGGVDLMVNNAGLGRAAPLMSGETERWREMLELNVLALCICTREAVADMRRRGDDGHVVHVSSMSAHRVPAGSGVYSASKFAVRSLTEGLRSELRQAGSKIRVSAISPGFVETEFAEVYHGDPVKAADTYSRFEVLQPEDIAAAIRTIVEAPPHVQIHDLLIRSTQQPS
jgi:NADP-dependent 3-hydroxy acid dehydrogenase YdfG